MQVAARTKNEVGAQVPDSGLRTRYEVVRRNSAASLGARGSGSVCEREREREQKMRTRMIMRRLPPLVVVDAAHINFHFRVAPSGLFSAWPGLAWLIAGTVATCAIRATLYYVKLIKIKKYFASFFISFSSAAQARRQDDNFFALLDNSARVAKRYFH